MFDTQKVTRRAKKTAALVYKATTLGAVGALFFLAHPGGYAAIRDYRSHHVSVAVDPNAAIVNLATRLTPADFRQIECLARNMYFEAAREGQAGMKAVGDVTLNRVRSGLYPDTICQVVYQAVAVGAIGKPGKCQFSWYCDGRPDVVTDKVRWGMAYEVAYNQYLYAALMPDLTKGATFYHADYVDPRWRMPVVAKIGAHIFYRPDPGRGFQNRPIK